jgi:hypothetical protein
MSVVASSAGGEVFVCDRCGADVGNGGVDTCLIVSDWDPDTDNRVHNYHFCRANKCDRRVMTTTNLEHFNKIRDSQRKAAAKSAPRKRTSTRKTGKAKSTTSRSER